MMGRTESTEIFSLVLPSIRDVLDMMDMKPASLGAPATSLEILGALILIP